MLLCCLTLRTELQMKHPQIAEIRQRETVRLDRKKNMENSGKLKMKFEWGSCRISVTKLCYMSGAHLITGTHCRTSSSYSLRRLPSNTPMGQQLC